MAARCHAWIDFWKDTGRSLSNPAPVGHTHKHPWSAELSPALGRSTSSSGRVKRQRELAGLRRGARRRILLACCHDLTLQRRERRSAHSVQAHGTPCLWISIPQFTATVTGHKFDMRVRTVTFFRESVLSNGGTVLTNPIHWKDPTQKIHQNTNRTLQECTIFLPSFNYLLCSW